MYFIDVRHYKASLLVPRLVYHLSTKLKKDVIQNCLGQLEEVKLICFLTRYGYATRANPYCKINVAYGMYTNMQNVTYINNCDDGNRVIPVTMFLVMLFNACFMYQPCNGMNLTNETFINTLSKFFPDIKLYGFRIIFVLIIL